MTADSRQHWPVRRDCQACGHTAVPAKKTGRLRSHINARTPVNGLKLIRCNGRPPGDPKHWTQIQESRDGRTMRWICRCGDGGLWRKDIGTIRQAGQNHLNEMTRREQTASA